MLSGRGKDRGDGNSDIGGQVLVFLTTAVQRHCSMGKQRSCNFSFSSFLFHLSLRSL